MAQNIQEYVTRRIWELAKNDTQKWIIRNERKDIIGFLGSIEEVHEYVEKEMYHWKSARSHFDVYAQSDIILGENCAYFSNHRYMPLFYWERIYSINRIFIE